ncbi:SRPBCC domain-containing protein [uncultured Roseibium sp.]|uniref:SRPBCC domain-containing protein n=1 Tax=uncultured Roseibium sp. TaxID=1936171 RepID=UPI00260FAB4D|nr:SRPBCC domain-containing protein [uncultured Roseibium sp.]
MKTYETQIDISAPPDVVWHILTKELPRAPETFGLLNFEGNMAPGAKIKIRSEVSPERTFALKVQTFEPPDRMVWTGGMPLGLFTGTRTFTVAPATNGSTFSMTEIFTGPMSGMITRSMPDLTPSFIKFAEALKTRAEAQ